VLQEYDSARDVRTHTSAEQQALERIGEGTALDLLVLLPEDQRSVILLRVLGDLSTDETAAAIGRSSAAVRKMQAKALATLRGLMTSDLTGLGSSHEEMGP